MAIFMSEFMDESEDIAAATVGYRTAADRSRFLVRAFATGLLAGFGHNPTIAIRDFDGEAQFAPETLADASLRLTVSADSLAVVDQMKEKDRQEIESTMRQQLLETARYPEIGYVSRNVAAQRTGEGRYRVSIAGELTLHGVTRPLSIAGRVILIGDELRAQGEFTIRQSDYAIEPVSVGMGALKLKDELQLTFDIVALRRAITMHELSIAMSIVEMAAEEAEQRGAKINAIHLRLGKLAGVVKEALLFSYELACQGTPLEGSRLLIEEMPVVVYCPACQAERMLAAINHFRCPDCATPTPEILQGKELQVVALEIQQ